MPRCAGGTVTASAIMMAVNLGTAAVASDGVCPSGQAATDYDDWKYLANNAIRTADDYASKRNPVASFVMADVDALFQVAGEHEGQYLVVLLAASPTGTAFAMLRPNFDFCSDPSGLDDERTDLFTVVEAKLNGIPF